MNWYEYALIIWIINLFLIMKIKEKHILEIQNMNFKHYHNMWDMHKKIIEITNERIEIGNERIDEIIEYIISENKE
ncbi:hypothetical protein [Spiroplasma ixodetis]|uniref:hypothetical protein n=1 Tax=Spiroplasma ixodetis TaxID=2141 RepID=UPI002577D66E|nr:hypothetical protein [Spiroplasma ixodetis]WJG69621.1 hypothetical protein SIXOD_v1c05310 [Spiroplasma ixodetis Y32]